MQPALTEHKRVDLVPFAIAVPELEVRPDLKWATIGEQVAQVLQPFPLMTELGRADLVPTHTIRLHGATSPPHTRQ
jgi:hypothetical protein